MNDKKIIANSLSIAKIKNTIWYNIAGMSVIMFLCFFTYRLYFWGDYDKNWPHAALNGLLDTIISVAFGIMLFKLQSSKKLKKWLLPITCLSIVGAAILLYSVHLFIYKLFHIVDSGFYSLFSAICFQLLDSVAIAISGALAILILQQQYDRKKLFRAMEILELENKTVELKYLKSQIDSHFVFNGLNMIYHQVPENNIAARESLLQFAGILRYHLHYTENEKLELQKELDYLKSYIQFQRKLGADILDIEELFEIETNHYHIEPLLLLPLVENAFKYCGREKQQKGKVNIHFRCTDNRLLLKIENTLMNNKTRLLNKNGIGIANVKKRLSALYDGRHSLILDRNVQTNTFTCQLELW